MIVFNTKPVALVLGGTVPHIELIIQLKKRGYYTILVDYLPNPPAKVVADEHIQESTLDQNKVLEIAKDRNASLVICGCVDQANITACYVMEQLGKEPPYSYEKAKLITNKGYMKKKMMENNIPTSKFYYVEDIAQADGIDISYPVMVKPADSNSSNGVKKAANKEEMLIHLKEALVISRNQKAIVEEFITGREISAYCFVTQGKAKLLMTAERISTYDGEKKVIKCYASIAPARISKEAELEAERIANCIARVFGLDNTPIFFQGIVNGDSISVIEFAPRVAGGISFMTIKENTGFDMISAVIDSYLGKAVSLTNYHKPKYFMSVNTIYGKDGVYGSTEGYEDLIADQTITHMFFHKTPGAIIDNSRASSSRIGAFISSGTSEEDMYKKVGKAYGKLNVYNEKGHSMIRRELNIYNRLYLKEHLNHQSESRE